MNPNFYERMLKETQHPVPNAVKIIIHIRNEYSVVSLACSDVDPIPYCGFLIGRVYNNRVDSEGVAIHYHEDWKIASEDDPSRSLTLTFGTRFPIVSNSLSEVDLLLLSVL